MVKEVKLADGSARTIKVRGRTQADALAKMAKRESMLAGQVAPENVTTVDAFLADWLATKKPLIRASTYRSYESNIRLYVLPWMGPKRLDRVSTRDVQGLVSQLAERGIKPTADSVRRTLKAAFTDAEKWGHLTKNPASLVGAVKVRDPNRNSWSMPDAHAFLSEAAKEGVTWYALFLLALVTGMRKGELLALRWQDIGGDRVYVRRNYTPYGDEPFVDPKTKHGRRTIPVTPSTIAVLDQLRTGRTLPSVLGKAPQVLDPRGQPVELAVDALVFPGRNGGPMNPKRPNDVMKALITKAGVPQIRFHDLRRTYASWMIGEGRDPKTVQYLLGQATPSFTLLVYADATAEAGDAAMEAPGAKAA